MVSRKQKEQLLNQEGKVIWMTGLSASGKTTVASALQEILFSRGYLTCLLDGDIVRSGLNVDLNFSEQDRMENVRRIAEVAKINCQNGLITICSFISPTREIRSLACSIIGDQDFVEIFIDTPLDICEERDPKGLYKKARAGEIESFTGISAPYETPENPDLHIRTEQYSVQECCSQILEYLNIG